MVNKRGLSEIVTTLIMVLLGIVIVGVIWAVVNGFVKNSTSQVQLSQRCSDSELEFSSVDCTTGVNCIVTVKRVKGTETLGGVVISLKNGTGQMSSLDVPGSISIAATQSGTLTSANGGYTITGQITEVEVMMYFSDTGVKKYCTSNVVKTNEII